MGSHLLVELTRESGDITALYRSDKRLDIVKHVFKFYKGDNWESDYNKIKWVKGDIMDVTLLLDLIEEGSDVYHCAALVSFHPKDFYQLLKINREGTANIVNSCLENKARKLCYVSSTAAVGGEEGQLITEQMRWKKTPTTSGYSIAKHSAEKEVWRGIEEGLNAVIVNPSVILGVGDWNDSSLTIFRTVAKGLNYFPAGSNAIVDARDVAEIMVKLMHSDISGERFLCVGSNQTFKLLVSEIADAMGLEPPKKMASKRMANVIRFLSSFGHMLSSSKPSITRETTESLYSHREYSNTKVRDALQFDFRTLPDTIANAIKGRYQS